jgi:hypothetical protein
MIDAKPIRSNSIIHKSLKILSKVESCGIIVIDIDISCTYSLVQLQTSYYISVRGIGIIVVIVCVTFFTIRRHLLQFRVLDDSAVLRQQLVESERTMIIP